MASSRAPRCPYDLADAGREWWRWAWRTEQAKKWDGSVLYAVARRAQLEDDLAAVGTFDPHSLDWFFSGLDLSSEERVQAAMVDLGRVIARLQALAGGKASVMREMRELEMQLGLGPKAMAALGWKLDEKPQESKLDELRARRAARAAGGATA